MKIKTDQITGLVLVLAGIGVAVLTSKFPLAMTAAYPGPKLLPSIAAFGFIVCGAGIFLQGTFSKKEQKTILLPIGWAKLGICFAVLCVYIFGMKYLGFLIMTPIASFVFCTLFAKGTLSRWWARVIYSVLATVIIYVVYQYAFGMLLPRGLLF